MIKLFKSKKVKHEFWKDCSIPAKLFFYNMFNPDLKFLVISGEPTSQELEKAWEDIQDEYYSLKKTRKSELVNKTRYKIQYLRLRLNLVKNAMNIFSYLPVNKTNAKKILKELEVIDIKFKTTIPVKERIKAIREQYIPSWETELEIELDSLEDKKQKEVSSFEESMQWISDVKNRHLPEDISLRRYIAEEKSAEKVAKLRLKEAS